MAGDAKKQIVELIEQPLAEEGCELAEVILSRYKGSVTVRILVYSANGVTVGECARLSHTVGDLIDRADLFNSGYALEISSPGLDRPLKTANDFKYRIGETVKVGFLDSGKKEVTGRILSATGENIELENESGVFKLGLSEIKQARILF
ncbi:MAG: hypothetical protein U9R56_03260 [candidate division Zixibacteria bacterium]|nr:hypothetical protein [candidate division Zixibacteria bacterium]